MSSPISSTSISIHMPPGGPQAQELHTQAQHVQPVQPLNRSPNQGSFALDRLHDLAIACIAHYLDPKSLFNWGRTNRQWCRALLDHRKNFPHIREASLWLSVLVQRIAHHEVSYKTLMRLCQIERDFLPAKFFPSKHISSVFFAPPPSSALFQDQEMIKKIATLAEGLERLTLYGNKITDSHVNLLTSTGLPALQELKLRDCDNIDLNLVLLRIPIAMKKLSFSSPTIQDTAFPHLNRFTQINTLCFQSCPQITGIFLTNLIKSNNYMTIKTTINTLDFNISGMTNAPLELLKHFPALHTLILSHSQVTGTGLEHIRNCTALQTLELAGLPIEDRELGSLEGLRTLRTLNLNSCPITDAALDCLKNWTQLHTLKLVNCRQFTGQGLIHLKKCTALHTLKLAISPIKDAALAHLSGSKTLHTLDLDHCPIRGSGLEHLKTCTSLSELSLSHCPVIGTYLFFLSNHLALKKLHLNHCLITDSNLNFLVGCSSLEILNLSRCSITDDGLAILLLCERLRVLHLERCPKISEAGLSTLIKHSSIKEIYISEDLFIQNIKTQLEERFEVSYCG